MRTGLVILAACVAASVSACVPKNRAAIRAKPVAATARPFQAMPSVVLADTQQTGPMYRVQIVAEITRDVMPTDDLAIDRLTAKLPQLSSIQPFDELTAAKGPEAPVRISTAAVRAL